MKKFNDKQTTVPFRHNAYVDGQKVNPLEHEMPPLEHKPSMIFLNIDL